MVNQEVFKEHIFPFGKESRCRKNVCPHVAAAVLSEPANNVSQQLDNLSALGYDFNIPQNISAVPEMIFTFRHGRCLPEAAG